MAKNNLFAHITSILALPFMVTIVVPALLHFLVTPKWIYFFHHLSESTIDFTSGFIMAIGSLLFISTVMLFANVGKGTLAPWDPPKHLVVVGPFKYVRNPMLCAVNLILIAIAFLLRNENIILWQLFFLVFNTLYFIKSEEPQLEKRFGERYNLYKKHVGRWIPRLTPWELPSSK